jgi:agmatine deiminase
MVVDADERPIPASHMNFLIANGAVVVPTYGNAMAARLACEALATVFPDHEIIPLPSKAILTGGGSFHCISQQEPDLMTEAADAQQIFGDEFRLRRADRALGVMC